MKKLLVISAMLLLIIGLGVLEICYDHNIYTEVKAELLTLHEILDKNEKNVDVEEVWKAYDKANKTWRDSNEIIFTTTNHNVVRNVNEKFSYLSDFIEANNYSDAVSTTNTLIDMAEYMREEKYVLLGNIF